MTAGRMREPAVGEFDRLALFRQWQDEPDATTGVEQQHDTGVQAWVSKRPVGNALFYGSQQVEAAVTHQLVTWRTERLNADLIGGAHVVDVDGMRYRVRRATDMNGGRAFFVADVEQLGAIP